jgi:hypothetical protein
VDKVKEVTMEVTIIGTEPPCPRCQETYTRVRQVIQEMDPTISIKKIAYSFQEAQSYGKVGSAHEIADWAKINVDWDKVREVASKGWTQELDDLLMPLKEKSEQAGWLMTPVVVINDKVVYCGCVPELNVLRKIIIHAKNKE